MGVGESRIIVTLFEMVIESECERAHRNVNVLCFYFGDLINITANRFDRGTREHTKRVHPTFRTRSFQ